MSLDVVRVSYCAMMHVVLCVCVCCVLFNGFVWFVCELLCDVGLSVCFVICLMFCACVL